VLRKFANESIPDADLLLTMLVYYIALFGACLATYSDKHITIEIVSNFVSEKTNNKLRLLSNLFSIWIMIILFFAAQDYISLQEGSLEMFMSFVPTYLVESVIVPVFGLIIFGFTLNSLILIRSFFKSEPANG
jgi:TRAP-type C4-dicarboxylate transport system permease small subunit